jgi:filamentous hemagglutinin family protein
MRIGTRFLGLFLALSLPAAAQVHPATNATQVRTSANGTPVVELAEPNRSGVSLNDFNSFNVAQKGLILNNSFLPGYSQIGGEVKHNPFYQWGEYAKLIVAQVVGFTPSSINGPVEIFGPRADFILANPNGIQVNGASFYNISRLTLTAGQAQYYGNDNVALQTGNSPFMVGIGGLRALTADDVTIMGHNILLDGPLAGGYLLEVLAGHLNYNYRTGQFTSTGARGHGWGIDASALGSIRAGRITLVSTSKGVGVRSKARMAASAGDITISANGRIRLKGSLRSNGRITVRSTNGGIVHSGSTQASGAVAFQATGNIDNRGSIESGSFLEFQSQDFSNEGQLLTSGAVLIDAIVRAWNSGLIEGDAGISAQAAEWHNLGQIVSTGVINLDTTSGFYNSGTISGNQGVALINGSGELVQAGQVDSFSGDLIEYSNGTLIHTGSSLAGGRAVLHANSDLSVQGTLDADGGLNLISGGNTKLSGTISTRGDLVAETNGAFTSAAKLDAGGAMQIDANGSLTSTETLNAGGDLVVSASTVNLDQGAVSGGNLQIAAFNGGIKTRGTLSTATNLVVDANGNIAFGGSVIAGQDLGIESSGSVNASGSWSAGRDLAVITSKNLVQLDGLNAVQAAIQAGGNTTLGGTIQTVQSFGLWVSGDLVNRAPIISGGAIGLNVNGNLRNRGDLQSGDTIALTTGGALDNSGNLTADAQARLLAKGTLTNRGAITSGTGTLIQTVTGALTNQAALTSLADIVVSSGKNLSNTGDIVTNTNAELESSAKLTDTGNAEVSGILSLLSHGSITSDGNLFTGQGLQFISKKGDITSNGNLESKGGIQLTAGSDATVSGKLITGSDLLVHAGGTLTLNGPVSAAGKADLASNGDLSILHGLLARDDIQAISTKGAVRTEGTIQTGSGIALDAGTNISDNANLLAVTDIALVAGNNLLITSNAERPTPNAERQTLIEANHNIAISAGDAMTNQGRLVSNNILGLQAASLDNSSGTLRSYGDITISLASKNQSAAGTLTNTDGSIQAARNIDIAAGNFTGPDGKIVSGWDTVISVQNWDNDSATLEAGRSLQLSLASGSNVNGFMQAGVTRGEGDLLLKSAGAFDNTSGTLFATRHVLLQTGNLTDTGGQITAQNGDLLILVNGAFANEHASLQSGRNLEISVKGNFDNGYSTIAAAGDSEFYVTGAFENDHAAITTGRNLAINTSSLSNTDGTISAGVDIAKFNVQNNVDNTGGTIHAGGFFNGVVAGTFTQAGTLTANGQVTLQAGVLVNTGNIASAGLVNLQGGGLDNNGSILGDLGVSVNFAAAAFQVSSLIGSYYGPVDITVDSGLTNQGTIETNQNIVLDVNGQLINQGSVLAGNNVTVTAGGNIFNTGTVSGGNDLLVTAQDSSGKLYQISNLGGSFLAGDDARFNTSFFANVTSKGIQTDPGWGSVAVTYPYGLGIGRLMGQVDGTPIIASSGYDGRLALILGEVDNRWFGGTSSVVSAGGDLVINSSGGGINQASEIVAGGTATLTGTWDNQGEGKLFGKNWVVMYEEAEGKNGNTDSLRGNDRYRAFNGPVTDTVVYGDNWNWSKQIWDYVQSPYFTWQGNGAQSPWVPKDALFPGTIDGYDAHNLFGIADSLRLKFVITSNPPVNMSSLGLTDQLGRPAIIDGLGGTNVTVAADAFPNDYAGSHGHVVAPDLPNVALSGLGPATDSSGRMPLAPSLPKVPSLAETSENRVPRPREAGTTANGQKSELVDAPNLAKAPTVSPVTELPQAKLHPSAGSSAETALRPLAVSPIRPLAASPKLAPIRGHVSTLSGQNFAASVTIDPSPAAQLPNFNSLWIAASKQNVELSPELNALLARDPIPDRSPIKALDHLLGRVFKESPLLDWAHNLKGAVVNATDPGRSIVKGVTGLGVPKGYTSRADWLASLRTQDSAGKGQGLFSNGSLFAGLFGSVPNGVKTVGAASQPDFLALLQAHRAWIAKNDPGFYGWQAQVEKQVQQEINAENHKGGGILGIIGLVVAVVVTIVLTAVSYGWFAPIGANILGTLTGAGSAAFTAASGAALTAVTAATTVGTFVVSTGIGFTAGFLGTLIGTGGNLGAAFENGLIGFAVAGVTFGLLQIQVVHDAVSGLISDVSGQLTAFGDAGKQFAYNFVNGLFQKTVGDATTIGLDQAFYGHSITGGAFLQDIGLFALTAIGAFAIAHLPILDQFWNSGPSLQLVQGDQATTVTLQNELLKPALEGGAAYGIGDLLGIKDPQALGIGTAVGSFAAPWITAGVDQFYGGQLPQGPALYTNNSYFSASFVPTGGNVALNVASQIDGLIGGLASYAYNGDFSIGQFGATQVYNFNDRLKALQSDDGKSRAAWEVPTGDLSDPYQYVQFGTFDGNGYVILDPQWQSLAGVQKISISALDQFVSNYNTGGAPPDAQSYLTSAFSSLAQQITTVAQQAPTTQSGAGLARWSAPLNTTDAIATLGMGAMMAFGAEEEPQSQTGTVGRWLTSPDAVVLADNAGLGETGAIQRDFQFVNPDLLSGGPNGNNGDLTPPFSGSQESQPLVAEGELTSAGAQISVRSIVAPESNVGSNITLLSTGSNAVLSVPGTSGASGLTVGDFLNQAQAITAASNAEAGGFQFSGVANTAGGPGVWINTPESMSERAASYQQFVTGADQGQAYLVNGVKFDGYNADAGILLEAKGPGYANFVGSNGTFMSFFSGDQALLEQASRQIQVAGDIPIQWHVAEPEAAEAINNLLQNEGLGNIEVIHTPQTSAE